jgi:hypothetical protein
MNYKGTIGDNHILPEVIKKVTKNVESGIYVVAYAGYAQSLKEYHVQINLGSSGYASDWPEWAYLLAREALLANKRLWVISTGTPYGKNLQQVLIYNY